MSNTNFNTNTGVETGSSAQAQAAPRDHPSMTSMQAKFAAWQQSHGQTEEQASLLARSAGAPSGPNAEKTAATEATGISGLASTAAAYLGQLVQRIRGEENSGSSEAQALSAVLRSDMSGLQQFVGHAARQAPAASAPEQAPASPPGSGGSGSMDERHKEDAHESGDHPSVASMERKLAMWEQKRQEMARQTVATSLVPRPRAAAQSNTRTVMTAEPLDGKEAQQVAMRECCDVT
jgi:hypothetical protein